MAMRSNTESEMFGDPKLAGDALERPIGRPLRYTPGLKCDAHLESLRPERYGNHRPIQGGEDWKRKLVQPPNHFEGSFSDADMQKFRPEPNPNNMEDPWYASRLPEQTMQSHERLAAPAATYGYPELPMSGPYGTMYPQDQLSQIKMRNRRFMNACAQEMNMGMMGPQPGMMMQPPPMMWGPPTLDHEMAHDELSVLDQELNMTRRANRPFVPQHHQDYYSLQDKCKTWSNLWKLHEDRWARSLQSSNCHCQNARPNLPLPKLPHHLPTAHKSTLPIKLPFDPSFLDRAWEKSPANLNKR